MRGDQRLALQWLEQLSQRQPDHPQLDAVRKLFPNGAPKNSSTPFQINLDQKSLEASPDRSDSDLTNRLAVIQAGPQWLRNSH